MNKDFSANEIKEKLKLQNLSTEGLKKILINRCKEHNIPVTKKRRKKGLSTRIYHVIAKCGDFKEKMSQLALILRVNKM